ncbi:hypothetical protein ABLV98_15625 [Staphylococcus sp. 50Mo3-1]|uniref:hypothetical protein n=1 Tax=Staphylococcus sp. 50Mo3-2 TaxID=3135642 RepID=UPI0033FC343C
MKLNLSQIQSIDLLLKELEIKNGISYKLVFTLNNDIVYADFSKLVTVNNKIQASENNVPNSNLDSDLEYKDLKKDISDSVRFDFRNSDTFKLISEKFIDKKPDVLFMNLLHFLEEIPYKIEQAPFAYNVKSINNNWELPIFDVKDYDLNIVSLIILEHEQN